jgi:hypothetical protein
MRRYLVALVLLSLLAGCAGAPKIAVNGGPPMNHLTIAYSTETKVVGYFVAIRNYEQKEGKEVLKLTEYLPLAEEVEIDKETTGLSVALRLTNNKKVDYSVWEVYSVLRENETYPYQVEHQLYSGSLSLNEISRSCPIGKVKSGTYRLEVRNGNGEPMFALGNLKYHRRSGGGSAN